MLADIQEGFWAATGPAGGWAGPPLPEGATCLRPPDRRFRGPLGVLPEWTAIAELEADLFGPQTRR